MSNMDVHLQQIKELISSCFVPPLKENLDEAPLQSEQFDAYREALELQLPILFDLLQQCNQCIFTCKDQEGYEILANLLVLLCEISAPTTIYRLLNESLQRNVNRILREQIPINKDAEHFILSFYQKKIGKGVWKKQLGALHGFLQFLQLQFTGRTLPKQWIHFCLSVSVIVHDSHEPTYKGIGISIFNLILSAGVYSYIQEQNIHSVIYDSACKDVDFNDSVEAAEDIWKCLYRCLHFFKELDSFKWSYLDNLIEKAIKNVIMAPDNLISLLNLQYVTKCGAYLAINQKDIETHCNADLNEAITLKQCRKICTTNNSYTIFRWAKNILNMFIDNSYKLMQTKLVSKNFLMEIHKCYLMCITPIQLEIIRPHLIPFLEKFIAVLMETIVTHKFDQEIIQSIALILETFKYQLQHSSDSPDNADYHKIYKVLDKLLKQHFFLQNK